MAGKRTVDIKLSFEQFDMMPGAAGKKFQRNLLLYGGSADTQGFSISQTAFCGSMTLLSRMGSRSRCRHQQVLWLRLARAFLSLRPETLVK
jgi:hypothetical protein